ncbi:glyoxalase [Devosia pacifica]|uniref:Glyoxalase n=1 Tax=Devosia pacifica TaxID=1335967 RepID=A0A918VWT4_9HYPH|nr:VOC family protein [Devosia pacifica]GHA32117.1 glyoxalase [Devosia pacifica]
MRPKVNIVTIGVTSLERAFEFYRVLFALPDERISAGPDHVAFFLDDDLSFVLLTMENLAATAGQGEARAGTAQVILSHTASSREEVDEVLAEAVRAGGAIHLPAIESEWGYAGYFADTEGNIWEVLAAAGGETVN